MGTGAVRLIGLGHVESSKVLGQGVGERIQGSSRIKCLAESMIVVFLCCGNLADLYVGHVPKISSNL